MPNNYVLGVGVKVSIVQVLGQYLIIDYCVLGPLRMMLRMHRASARAGPRNITSREYL